MPNVTNFKGEFAWSATWIPKIREIIGPLVLREGTLHEDQHEATDLIVLRAEGLRIACRLRRPGYAEKYAYDVTITAKRESGAACEWDKLILGGFGDWFFYGHATQEIAKGGNIIPRHLIDLNVARPWILENHGPLLGPNKDGAGKRCWFYAVDVRVMQAALGKKALLGSRVAEKKTTPSTESWLTEYSEEEAKRWPTNSLGWRA